MVQQASAIVVGGGLFGSAAARHLAESGSSVTVVNSPEPPESEWATHTSPMASHYDQGRIVRRGGGDPVHAALATASFDRFPFLATRSGIGFFRPHPLVVLTADPEREVGNAEANEADIEEISLDELSDRTGIVAPAGFVGGALIQRSTAGVVNPRLVVEAQLRLARAAGAVLVNTPAVEVRHVSSPVCVVTADGREHKADRLVLATGPYGADLIGLDRRVQRRLRTIALIEVDGPGGLPPAELPSLSASGFLYPNSGQPTLEETYWVPPIAYPDGGVYLKIGGNSLPMITAASNDDIGPWFSSGGSAVEAEALFELATDLLPRHQLRLAGHKPCVVSYTDDERPIIEQVDDRVILALAGNGSGATIGDEVGRRAAALALR